MNFLEHILTSLMPRDFLFQLTQAEKSGVVANCDHFQNLTFHKAPPFAFTEHGAIQATNVLTMKVSKGLEFPLVALPGVWHMPATGGMGRKRRGCFLWRLRGRRSGCLLGVTFRHKGASCFRHIGASWKRSN